MGDKTAISWTDATWNPTTGCTKVSAGCKHCYAETMAKRIHVMNPKLYVNGFTFELHPDRLDQPIRWRKPRRIFVNSMSDLFHEDCPDSYIRQVVEVMESTPRHTYQVLTKRPARMARVIEQLAGEGVWTAPRHIWVGTSVENAKVLDRVTKLGQVPAAVRFLSCEPLIGPLPDLDLTGIHWVIVGGESGQHLHQVDVRERRGLSKYIRKTWHPRADRVRWVTQIRDACVKAGVAFFFKQWGGARPKDGGRLLEGREWAQMPDERSGLEAVLETDPRSMEDAR